MTRLATGIYAREREDEMPRNIERRKRLADAWRRLRKADRDMTRALAEYHAALRDRDDAERAMAFDAQRTL